MDTSDKTSDSTNQKQISIQLFNNATIEEPSNIMKKYMSKILASNILTSDEILEYVNGIYIMTQMADHTKKLQLLLAQEVEKTKLYVNKYGLISTDNSVDSVNSGNSGNFVSDSK